MSDVPTLAKLRELDAHLKASGAKLQRVQFDGAGVQLVLDELNAEQGRTIDPPRKGEQLPEGTDKSKVKFGPSSFVFFDGICVMHAPQ